MPTAVIPRSTSARLPSSISPRPATTNQIVPFRGGLPSSNSAPIPSPNPVYSKYDPYIPGKSPKPSTSYTPPPAPAPPPKTTNPSPLSTGNPAPYSLKPPAPVQVPTIPTASQANPLPTPATNPARVPSAAPPPPLPLSPGAAGAARALSAARGVAGTSVLGSAASAGVAIALGADPRQAVATATGSFVGSLAGAAVGSLAGPPGIAIGATLGSIFGAAAVGALMGGVAQNLSPMNQLGGGIPVGIPDGGIKSNQRYRLMYGYHTKNSPAPVSGFSYGTATGANLAGLFASFNAWVTAWGDSYRLTEAYLIPVEPILGDEQAGSPTSLPNTSLGSTSGISAPSPTDQNGNPVVSSPAPSASPKPGLSPVVKPGSVPKLAPAPAPAVNPATPTTPGPYAVPGVGPSPRITPFAAPGLSPIPSPRASTGAPPTGITAIGLLPPASTPSPQTPRTPSTRSRSGDCCDPLPGTGGECKFKPLEIVPISVKQFVACLSVAPHTPIYRTISVNVVKGTEDQISSLFNQVAELAGANCKAENSDPSKVKVKVVQCGQPDKLNPPEGLVKAEIQLDENGKKLPPNPYHEVEVEVPCIKGLEDEVKKLYEQLGAIRKAQCIAEENEFSKKTYQILGGDDWFPSDKNGAIPKKPKRFDKFDASFRKIAETNFKVTDKERELAAESRSLPELLNNCFGSLYYRTGIHEFPTQVSETMSTYSDSEPEISIYNLSNYLAWFIRQFDLLVGQFPIEIEIEDTDPATKGNQTKKVELPNLSEALAELYGVAITGSTNADLAINFLMRLSSEVIATKNSSLITQDYAKANASFLGYRGNPKQREIDYSFNPAKLDSLEDFLQNSKGSIVGWSEDDPESVVGYLQKLAFSAGIIKAAFLRNSGQLNRLAKEMQALFSNPEEEKIWKAFIEEINNPESPFNAGVQDGHYPLSLLDDKPVTDGSQENSDKKPKK